MYLLNENAFQILICQNLVTCPNDAAGTSHSAVSEKSRGSVPFLKTIGTVTLAAFGRSWWR